ncbi:MAG: FIST C-terminal domain-containing protein [Anaerolineales bacterium]|nr:FIST C-terminal domain-containing protein [Anaerolineales bacterium]MCX7755197.1 FIST C-terminal domain-containing protein [Anaerolineales bacterium]MDW8278762.1 FIST N-terminal domain-containing protein [Anaerolineales bacterium]
MAIVAAVGEAYALDPREAGLQAAHYALNRLGNVNPVLGILIVPHRHDPQKALDGVTSLLGNIPILGFSSFAGITEKGTRLHTVVVALLAGETLRAETHWYAAYGQSSGEMAARIMELLSYEQRPVDSLLVFADGLEGNAEEFCAGFPARIPLWGGLSSGDLQSASGFQIAGMQTGHGAVGAAFLRGGLQVGIGYGHGWVPVGTHFRVTRSRGFWLRTLDGRPASETYAQMFGKPAREWSFPPINYLTRIYPLGFEQQNSSQLKVRAPLRVEADGSFRMNAFLRDGSDAYLMIGSPADCHKASVEAAQQAVHALNGVRPVFALILVDIAWYMLMQTRVDAYFQAIQDVLGANIPIAGGYTLGQIIPADSQDEHPRFLNQNILVAAFGEKE